MHYVFLLDNYSHSNNKNYYHIPLLTTTKAYYFTAKFL